MAAEEYGLPNHWPASVWLIKIESVMIYKPAPF